MNPDVLGVNLYILNLALLVTHQIDSAYWKEWELLHVPGGPQLNLILNFVLLLVGLAGLSLVMQGAAVGRVFALFFAAGGIFAFAIHAYFLSRGDLRFRAPVSIGLLLATLAISIPQAALALRAVIA